MSKPIVKKLSIKDVDKIKKKQSQFFLFLVFFLTFFSGLTFFVLKDLDFSNITSFITIGFLSFFLLILVGIFVYIHKKVYNDLQSKEKYCFEGVIEKKTINSHATTKKRTRSTYFLIINNVKHKVNIAQYSICKVGDTVYFEITPSAKIILTFEVLKKNKLTANPRIGSFREKPKRHESRLTVRDKQVITHIFKQKLKIKCLFSIPPMLLIIGLIYSKMGYALVVLFPIPLILIYQLIKIVQLYFNYQKALQGNRKNIATNTVIDKFIKTGNKIATKQRLVTNFGSLQVPNTLFNKVKVGDEIQIHTPHHFEYKIVITHEGNDYYIGS